MLLNDTKCFATVISTMETRLLSISKASPIHRMHKPACVANRLPLSYTPVSIHLYRDD